MEMREHLISHSAELLLARWTIEIYPLRQALGTDLIRSYQNEVLESVITPLESLC